MSFALNIGFYKLIDNLTKKPVYSCRDVNIRKQTVYIHSVVSVVSSFAGNPVNLHSWYNHLIQQYFNQTIFLDDIDSKFDYKYYTTSSVGGGKKKLD